MNSALLREDNSQVISGSNHECWLTNQDEIQVIMKTLPSIVTHQKPPFRRKGGPVVELKKICVFKGIKNINIGSQPLFSTISFLINSLLAGHPSLFRALLLCMFSLSEQEQKIMILFFAL